MRKKGEEFPNPAVPAFGREESDFHSRNGCRPERLGLACTMPWPGRRWMGSTGSGGWSLLCLDWHHGMR